MPGVVRNLHAVARFMLVVIAAVAAFALSDGAPPTPSAGASAPATTDHPESIVVRARSVADFGAIAEYARARGYAVKREAPELSALELLPPPGAGMGRALADFAGRPGVFYVEPTYRVTTAEVPNDPLYSRSQAYLTRVKAPQAWDIEKGKSSVLVAVLDTGVDLSHPDLQGRIWVNPGEIANNAVDDDGNGCIDDVNGCAFVSFASGGCSNASNGFVRDDDGHGTFVTGVIAANGNGQGMVGVARGVTVMAVKVIDCIGSGNTMDVAQGLIYAARNGAKVVNVSLGSYYDSVIMREAVRIATEENGALIVAASGNSGKTGVAYPARYPGVLAVGASTSADARKRAPFSSYGPEVDIVAVGEKIVGTVPQSTCKTFLPCTGGPYAVGNGTSFSTPQVTGLVALILSRRPGTPPQAVIDAIKTSAEKVPDGGGPAGWAGAGLINMLEALRPQFRIGAPGVSKN